MSHTANVRRAQEQERQRNARQSVPPDGFYGRLTGKVYDSEVAMRHHERLEMMRRNKPSGEQEAFDNLPAEKIRELFNQAATSEQEKIDQQVASQDIGTFLELHPEYDDSNKSPNGPAMKIFLTARGIKYPTLAQLEEAFETLSAQGMVQLKPEVVVKQQQEIYKQRAEDFRASRIMPSDDELSGMSLEEIRRRASHF